jgi:hypothetical protein
VVTYRVRTSTQRVISMVILVAGAVAFVALAVTAMLTDHDVLSGTFGLLALLAFSLAALAPRIHGEVKASLSGFSFELVREIVDAGQRTDSPDAVTLAAIRKALREHAPLAGTGAGASDEEPDDTYRSPTGTTTERLADDLLTRAHQALASR